MKQNEVAIKIRQKVKRTFEEKLRKLVLEELNKNE